MTHHYGGGGGSGGPAEGVGEVGLSVGDDFFQKSQRPFVGVQPFDSGEIGGAFVAHEHGRKGLYVEFHRLACRFVGHGDGTFPVGCDTEDAVVPLRHGVGHDEMEGAYAPFERIEAQELGDVHDAGHEVGFYRLLYLTFVEQEGQRFARVDVSLHGVYHGVVRPDKVPQPLAGLLREIDHFADVENVLLHPVEQESLGGILCVVINRRRPFLLVLPAPILHPLEIVADEGAVRAAGETVVRSLDVFVAYGEPFDMARHLDGFRYLRIFQGKGDVVGHDFPPLASVIGNGVGIEIGDILLRLAHLLQCKPYQVVHQAHAGEFGVGAHSRHAAHSEDAAVNVHFARIDTYLRHEFVVVGEPAEYVGFLQNRTFGASQFPVLIAALLQLPVGDLKDISQQFIVLVEVFQADGFYLQALLYLVFVHLCRVCSVQIY